MGACTWRASANFCPAERSTAGCVVLLNCAAHEPAHQHHGTGKEVLMFSFLHLMVQLKYQHWRSQEDLPYRLCKVGAAA